MEHADAYPRNTSSRMNLNKDWLELGTEFVRKCFFPMRTFDQNHA